jgi:hypothetical protein
MDATLTAVSAMVVVIGRVYPAGVTEISLLVTNTS